MKTILNTTAMLAVLMLTSTQAQAQLKGGGDETILLPAVQKVREIENARDAARTAFYASYDAYLAARSNVNNNYYWWVSSEYQFEALVNCWSCWNILEEALAVNTVTDLQYIELVNLASDAEDAAYGAAYYAWVGNYYVPSATIARDLAFNSWNKIELLVDLVAIPGLTMP